MRRSTVCLVTGILLFATSASAQSKPEPPYTPSTFEYGFDGFFLGGAAGLGAGYLAARSGGWEKDDWRALVYGAGIGALAGGALGLGLGISDMASETPGRGYFILRDGGYGLSFGAVAGGIAGAIAAASAKKAERILLGASIGALAGTAVGVVLGIVEGQRTWRRRQPAVALTLTSALDAHEQLLMMPALTGRY